MAQRPFSHLQTGSQTLLSMRAVILCTCYLLLNIGLTVLMGRSLLLGLGGIIIINLLVWLFSQPRWAIPLYILVATPSLAMPLGGTGILSRLFAGHLVMILLIIVGVAYTVVT